MKNIQRILLVFLIMFSAINISAQDDFDVKISETEINEAIEALCGARGINFGDYSGGIVEAWYANLDAAHIEILPNNVVNFYVDDMYFVGEIDLNIINFSIAEHIGGMFTGEFIIQGDETIGYSLILRLNSVDNMDSYGDLTDLIDDDYAELFESELVLDYIPDIPLSLTSLTPELITDVFNLGTPPISTDDGNIYINYNVIGDRFVKIFNELQLPSDETVDTEGDIYHLESSSYQPYSSGFEFAWDKNSQHTFKSEENGIDYNVDNNHYKFEKWVDGELPEHYSIFRSYVVSEDKRFTAKLLNSHTVNFNMTYEGITGSFGNVNISGTNYTFPKSEYIYAAPLAEPVTINSSISNSGINYQFLNWSDGNESLTRNISPTATTNLTANYKGIQLSSTYASYNKNNQNKMVRVDGKLYKVYESMNRIWLERSSNNGNTWELMNSAKPIDAVSGGKYPSISHVEYNGSETFAIVYNLSGELRLQIWSNGTKDLEVLVPADSYYPNGYVELSTVPVVSFNCYGYNGYHNRNGKILIAWEFDGYVLYQFGILADAVVTWNDDVPEYISSSDAENLTVSKYGLNTFHLAWQEDWSDIRYCKLGISGGGGNIVTVSDQATISTGGGYPTNFYPSITTTSSGYPAVAWVTAQYYNSNTPKIIRRLKYSSGWSSTFSWYGSNVPSYPQINMAGTNYVVAWIENAGAVKIAMPWGSVYALGTSGSYIQLANGESTNTMYGSVLNTASAPYSFTTTASVGGAYKTSSASFNQGRGVVASIDTTQFFFIMGDVSLNKDNIGFEELPDTLIIDKKTELEDYLLTESFQFGDNDEIELSLYMGVSDSVSANSVIGKNKKVNFAFELIEDKTNKVLGKYKNFVHKKGAIINNETKSYKISGKGIGNKTVRLRLVIDTNIDGTFTLLDVKDNQKVLGKFNANDVEVIAYAGDLAIKDYELSQNYPNPFNPSTTIKYQIPNDGMVSLKIYDITGQEVKTLVNQAQTMGRYEANFDASNLSSGVYFYRIQSGSFTKSMKMILLK